MLQRCIFGLAILFSWSALAGNFSYLPSSNGPEKELQSLMESGNFRHALMTWESSQRNSAFAQSNTGVATYSYLLFQNGLRFTALQSLMQNTQPSKIDAQLLKMWTIELKNSVYIQKGWIQTSGGWKAIFNNEPVVIHIRNKADIAKTFTRAAALSNDNVNEKARIWWQIATQAPLINDVDSSLKALKLLRESGQSVIGQDLISMTQGHVLYQKGDLTAALEAYKLVPKSSSLWVDGVEERAWTHFRQGDYDRAVGDVTTALSPVLAPLAGPETYFLANLLAYRVCDYSRVFNNSDTFKTRHHNRLSDIQDLALKGSNASINEVFERFEKNGVSAEAAGPKIESIPRGLIRDQQFVRSMESRREILSELKQAAQLSEDVKTLGSSANLEKTFNEVRHQADQYRQLAFQRARLLAQADLKEYRTVLNKMHIIEAEVIQRLHMDDNLKGERSKLSKNDDSGDVLVFPYTKEVWMDELDNYKARVKDCPTLKGASL